MVEPPHSWVGTDANGMVQIFNANYLSPYTNFWTFIKKSGAINEKGFEKNYSHAYITVVIIYNDNKKEILYE